MSLHDDLKINASPHRFGGPLNIITRLFPFVLILAAFLGVAGFYYMYGFESALKSLIYAIPLLLVALFTLTRRPAIELDLLTCTSKIHFDQLFLFTILLFIVSLVTLNYYPTRPLIYFIFVALISGLLFLQIISHRKPWTDYVIIVEIILLSLNIIWGVSLKYPLYFGYTDILGDLPYIDSIIQSEHIRYLESAYRNFPLYYVFNAVASEITALSVRDTLFIFSGLIWQIGILFTYLIFKKLSNSSKLALVACLLFASSSEIVFYGAYSITRALAFIILLGCLYLFLNKTKLIFVLFSLILMLTLILTHHITVLFTIPILLVLYLCQHFFSRRYNEGISILPISLLIVGFFGYLVFIAGSFTDVALTERLALLFSPENQAGAENLITQPPSLISLLYYSFVLLLSLTGIGILFKANVLQNQYANLGGVAVASLIYLVLYMNGPLNLIPQSQNLLFYRLPLMVSPFIAIMMAFGVAYLISKEVRIFRKLHLPVIPVVTVGIIAVATFFSMISGPNASDYHNFSYPDEAGDTYFTNSELDSFDFINSNANPSYFLYSDYETVRNQYSLSNIPFRRILTGGNIEYITRGYIVLRVGEMNGTGGLSFSLDGMDITYRYYIEPPQSYQNDILVNLSKASNIYNDGDVRIYLINNSD